MPPLFISYVAEDTDVVELLAGALEATGYWTWYYTRDSLPGSSYLVQTAQAIEQAGAVIVVVSPHALREPHQVTLEVVRAHESGKPLVPLLRDCVHEALHQVPEWQQALGAAVSEPIPPTDITAMVPRLLRGLQALGLQPERLAQPASLPITAVSPPGALATGWRRLRQGVARSWRRLGSWLAVLVIVLHGLNTTGLTQVQVPGVTGQPWSLVLAFGLFLLVRFPRLARRITRVLLGPPQLPTGLPRLFRGPRPYGQDEVLPGRQQECNDCWQQLRAAPFFILEGESGCGKSSLLHAALLQRAGLVCRVVTCRLADDPLGKLYAALRQEPYRPAATPPTPETLATAIAQAAAAAPMPLLLAIDQGEELFVTVRDAVREAYLRVLQAAIAAGQLRVLITIRSDFRDLLDRLCRVLDPQHRTFDLGQYYTLHAFRARQARAVLDEILRPAVVQDAGLRQQLDDFAGVLVDDLLRPPRDPRLCQEDEKTVLPVELQTVGMLLETVGFQQMSVAGLRRQGGKAGLMRTYIGEAKKYAWHKTAVPEDQTLRMLQQLISPAGTKWAQTAADIGQALGTPAAQAAQVLDAFTEKYLVNRLPAEAASELEDDPVGAQRYELRHEYLVQILAEAPDPMLQKAQDAAERLRFWLQRTQAAMGAEAPHTPRRLLARLRALFVKPIPLVEGLRLWRYARQGEERRMLQRNLRGFSARVLLVLLLLSPVWWYLYTDVPRRVHAMGALVVRNVPGATLTLRCIRHYNTSCAFVEQTMRGRSVWLAGPADYVLMVQGGTAWQVRYPVYIEGYGHRVEVAIAPPPVWMPEGMAFIPGGIFRMGTKDIRGGTIYSNELPAHDVEVDGFFMDRYEVTNAQYRQCVVAGKCDAPHYDDSACYSFFTGTRWQKAVVDSAFREDAKPVVCIDWQQAKAYCEFRGYRLPTEAEWEKAAVGPEGYITDGVSLYKTMLCIGL
jgi:hypothetical protein